MMGQEILDVLGSRRKGIRGTLTLNVPISKVTWLRVGGFADLLFQPIDEEDLSVFLTILPSQIPVTVLGLGSNVLVRDGGIEGVVIRLSASGFGGIHLLGDESLKVGTAVPNKRVAYAALEASIDGFSFYYGIPGSIGGALRTNAGANGSETQDRVIRVRGVNRMGNIVTLSLSDMHYVYRHSGVDSDLIFTSVILQGIRGEKEMIKKKMNDAQGHRDTVQPIRERTAGSTFKNPLSYSSWKLIDEAGLRGFQIGGALMSCMHCNFMINTGPATGYDLETLGETVRERVFSHSGVLLQWEIKRLGRFSENQEVRGFAPGK
ncbi:UDP-N-acetylmuramate dehydrogenase [Candidatus Endowatersipora endosymbiont of Watersipora subatra]|uniref:UDP-N-acetylmuramate dehydrogenase n=1 Tax=Candidatus Endowatersipora endosymbiont of Watersipora subatra TaxID=3077946 RepID=UPI00312C9395